LPSIRVLEAEIQVLVFPKGLDADYATIEPQPYQPCEGGDTVSSVFGMSACSGPILILAQGVLDCRKRQYAKSIHLGNYPFE